MWSSPDSSTGPPSGGAEGVRSSADRFGCGEGQLLGEEGGCVHEARQATCCGVGFTSRCGSGGRCALALVTRPGGVHPDQMLGRDPGPGRDLV